MPIMSAVPSRWERLRAAIALAGILAGVGTLLAALVGVALVVLNALLRDAAGSGPGL